MAKPSQTPQTSHFAKQTNQNSVNGGSGGINGGGILSNSVQDIARSGSTYDITGTFRRQEALERADSSLRSATMSQNAQAQVMLAAGESSAAGIGTYNDHAFGSTTVSTRGAGVDVGSAENRATLASQDAAHAVQVRRTFLFCSGCCIVPVAGFSFHRCNQHDAQHLHAAATHTPNKNTRTNKTPTAAGHQRHEQQHAPRDAGRAHGRDVDAGRPVALVHVCADVVVI